MSIEMFWRAGVNCLMWLKSTMSMTTLWLMCVDGIESRWSVRLDVDASMIWLFDSTRELAEGTQVSSGRRHLLRDLQYCCSVVLPLKDFV